MKHLRTWLLASLCAAGTAAAQTNGSNSPYSRYGFGLLNDRTGPRAAAMGGTSYASRGGRILNLKNPASFSAVDSLTFLFDIGLSLQNGNFNENGRKVNARNTEVDYVAGSFRATKRLGVAIGMIPYSTIGYKMSTDTTLSTATGEVTETDSYQGDGGLHEVFLGLGWEPLRGLSIGVSAGYLWGDLTHTITASYSDATYNTRRRQYEADIRTYKLDFGLQYEQRLGKRDRLALGLTYGLGHDVNRRGYYYDQVLTSSSTYVGDTLTCENAYQLPHTFGAGLMWSHDERLHVGFDYTYQRWGDVKTPVVGTGSDGNYIYEAVKGQYKDMHKFSLGAEFTPNPSGLKWRDHVSYRLGMSYTSPYTRVNGADGPRDYLLTAGVALPLVSLHSERSCMLNVAFQWEHVQPKYSTQVKENYLRLCLGISFNEPWFRRWKAN